MNIPKKPQPTKKYLSLSGREATIVAYKVATKEGVFDNQTFMSLLGEWQKKNEEPTNKPKNQLQLKYEKNTSHKGKVRSR